MFIFGVFALFSLRFFIDHETRAETNKVQQNQNILKYIDIQRYLISLSVPIARSGLIAYGLLREALFFTLRAFLQ